MPRSSGWPDVAERSRPDRPPTTAAEPPDGGGPKQRTISATMAANVRSGSLMTAAAMSSVDAGHRGCCISSTCAGWTEKLTGDVTVDRSTGSRPPPCVHSSGPRRHRSNPTIIVHVTEYRRRCPVDHRRRRRCRLDGPTFHRLMGLSILRSVTDIWRTVRPGLVSRTTTVAIPPVLRPS